MSYLEGWVQEIERRIDSGVMFKIGNINIKPRDNDLPNHYTKRDGQNGTWCHSRINTVLNAGTFFVHEHLNCPYQYFSIEKIPYKKGYRFIICIPCQRAKVIIERLPNKTFVLVSAYELRSHITKKIKQDSPGSLCEFGEVEQILLS